MHIFLNQMARTILSDTKKMNMLCLYPHEACVMCSLVSPLLTDATEAKPVRPAEQRDRHDPRGGAKQ